MILSGMTADPLPLAITNYGFLYRLELPEALREISHGGYELVELSGCAPQLDLSALGPEARRELKRTLDRNGLRCMSLNPVEMNPISLNGDLHEAAYRQYRAAIELAAELEAETIVMLAGRRNPLTPMPEGQARRLLAAQLERLLPVAQKLGVTLTLEPVPYGFLETGGEVASYIRELGADGLGITLDCANSFFVGVDPADDLRATGELLSLVHISDSSRTRWGHTRIGQGEIDFAAFADALREIAYPGLTVYELVDEHDPAPWLREDRALLATWGWS